MIKITHNLNNVIDYVESLKNEIISLNASAIEKTRLLIYTELQSIFGESLEEIDIELSQDGYGNVIFNISNIDFDEFYAVTGYNEDYLFEFVENYLFNQIEKEFKEADFEWQ